MLLHFFDDDTIQHLYPLTLTRPAADLRCGMLTIAEKWVRYFKPEQFGYTTLPHLAAKYKPLQGNVTHHINGRLLPSKAAIDAIGNLKSGQQLWKGATLLARCSGETTSDIQADFEVALISRPYDLFINAVGCIQQDFELLTHGKTTQVLNPTVQVLGDFPIFLEEGAKVNCSVLNAGNGPIYIGKNAEIMEGCLVRGPLAMCEGSVLKLGAKVYGPTVLGPYCVVGGEVNNISMQGYSNKGHDGFLGNAVLGEWCNIGADSNCSNLKNNYEDVKVWNYATGKFDKSGQQFCGLIMGDHSKCGINTMFNTGTVVGVSANIFGSGFPRQFIPDFAWGGASGFITYKLDAACKTAGLVMPRRKKEFNETEKAIMESVFSLTAGWRNWEVSNE